MVGFYCVVTFILQGVGPNLVEQSDAASFLPQVKDDANSRLHHQALGLG